MSPTTSGPDCHAPRSSEATLVVRTARGRVRFPAYMPVTTFGDDYPVDRLIQPFLPRFADVVMIAYHWAMQMNTSSQKLPVFVDSGGFACLLPGHSIEVRSDGTGCIVRAGALDGRDDDEEEEEEDAGCHQLPPRLTSASQGVAQRCAGFADSPVDRITPEDVLSLQNAVADFGSTLDFPIPLNGIGERDRSLRVDLTLANARWVMASKVSCSRMFASVQGWDLDSYAACANSMLSMGFRDLAIGGLVPRLKDRSLVFSICRSLKKLLPDGGLLHAFGVGDPELVRALFALGVTSTDSSSYVRTAVGGKRWDGGVVPDDPTAIERAHAALMNLQYASRATSSGTRST